MQQRQPRKSTLAASRFLSSRLNCGLRDWWSALFILIPAVIGPIVAAVITVAASAS